MQHKKLVFYIFSLCILPGLAKACANSQAFSKSVHLEPGAAQELVIYQKLVSDGCAYDLAVKKSGRIILHTNISIGNKNSPPPAMHVTGQPGNPFEFRVSLVHINGLNSGPEEILIYDWATGGDAGASRLNMYGFFKGGVRRLLHLSEAPGSMFYHADGSVLHVGGQMTTSCMACGAEKKLALRWDRQLGGFVLANPGDYAFAKYMNYINT